MQVFERSEEMKRLAEAVLQSVASRKALEISDHFLPTSLTEFSESASLTSIHYCILMGNAHWVHQAVW